MGRRKQQQPSNWKHTASKVRKRWKVEIVQGHWNTAPALGARAQTAICLSQPQQGQACDSFFGLLYDGACARYPEHSLLVTQVDHMCQVSKQGKTPASLGSPTRQAVVLRLATVWLYILTQLKKWSWTSIYGSIRTPRSTLGLGDKAVRWLCAGRMEKANSVTVSTPLSLLTAKPF